MGKYVSVLALIAGLGLAVMMHSTNTAQARRAGPSLPALVQPAAAAGVTIGGDWPAPAELAGLQAGCVAACAGGDFGPLAPWEEQPPLPEFAGDLRLTWPGRQHAGQRLQPGPSQLAPLARLRATPLRFAAEPLPMTATAAKLDDAPLLELAPLPEPHNWALFITGMLLVGGRLRRRQRQLIRPAPYLATL